MKQISDNQLVIYQNENGEIKVKVLIQDETIWLTQAQIAELFNKDRSVITKHINKILAEGELDNQVCAKIAHTGSDGKVYNTKYYNLDMIISIGYRVNSKRGIEFRRWASNVLKDHLIKGYSLNQQQISNQNLLHLKQTIELLSNTLINQNLVNAQGAELLSLITAYTKTWDLLIGYDEGNLNIPNNLPEANIVILNYEEARKAIDLLKKELEEENSNFIDRCVILESAIGHHYSPEDLLKSDDIWTLVSENAGTLRQVAVRDGKERILMDCKRAAKEIIEPAFKLEILSLEKKYAKTDIGEVGTSTYVQRSFERLSSNFKKNVETSLNHILVAKVRPNN